MNLFGSVVSGRQFPRTSIQRQISGRTAGEGILLLLVLFVMLPAVLRASDGDRVEAGEISAYGGDVKITHFVPASGDELQVGGKIYVGDEVETGPGGTVELLFGLNVRMRLAGSTAIRINGRKVTAGETGETSRTTTQLEVLLRRGELRTRVRENLVTPTPVLVMAANMQLLLPRSDCLLRRAGTGAENLRSMFLLLGWGRCVLNVKATDEKDWVPDAGAVLSAIGAAEIPEFPVGAYVPRLQKAGPEEAQKTLQLLPFTVDEQLRAPGVVPTSDPELDGA